MLIIWGAENYGRWIYLLAAFSLINIILLQITDVVRFEITNAFANKKYKYLKKIFYNSIFLYGINIIILAVLGLVAKSFINIKYAFAEGDLYKNIDFIFIFILMNLFLDIIKNFFYPTLSFDGSIKLWTKISIFGEILSKLLIIISAILFEFHFAFFFYFLSNFIIVTIIAYSFYIKNYNNYFVFSKKLFSFKIIKKIFILSITYFLEKISFIIKNDGLIFLVGNYFNLSTVSLISTMKTLFTFFPMKLLSILTFSSHIEFSKLKLIFHEKILIMQKKYFKLTLIFLLLFILGSLIFGKFFYELWIHTAELNFNYKIMLFLITDISIILLLNTLIAPFKGLNKFFNISVIDLLNSIIAFVFCFIILKINLNLYFLLTATVAINIFNLMIIYFVCKNYFYKRLNFNN
jgi:O-antigen/teichoic acid export membrane protein